jgi:hypothetical protein
MDNLKWAAAELRQASVAAERRDQSAYEKHTAIAREYAALAAIERGLSLYELGIVLPDGSRY